jgi:hypothetical protein
MGKAKRAEQDEGPSMQEKKKKRDRRRPNHNTVAGVDREGKR